MANLQQNQEEVFLATTALEGFWDTSKRIVFLGEWCRRFNRRSFWKNLGDRIVKNHWIGRNEKNRQDLKTLYEKLLPVLACSLNRLHNMNASNRYWRILLGPWLNDYLGAVYDRTLSLEAAKNQFPNFSTILLSEESHITPSNSSDFNWLMTEDGYNLQIYTKILSFWGNNFPRKPLEIRATPLYVKPKTCLEKIKIKGFFKLLFQSVGRIVGNIAPITLENSYFHNTVLIQLFLRTRGIFWSYFYDRDASPQFPLEMEKRSLLGGDLLTASNSELERLLAHILPSDIPQNFIEGFRFMCDQSEQEYPKKPKVIFSANAWHYSDGFKQWAAAKAESGVPLVGTQHGGNYGSALYHASEDHELEILDQFYSWGWKHGRLSHKIKPFPSSKLSFRKRTNNNPNEKSILFGTTIAPRYVISGNMPPQSHFDQYLLWQSRFVKTLSPSLHLHLRARLHCVDYGWDMQERWQDFAPNVLIENWSVPFLESLEKCRLYVCDHLSTTFIESLVADKPTLLYWDFDVNPLHPEAKLYYDALHSVGILHDSPESAGSLLNSVYEDIEAWWNRPECRKVRQDFCHHFGRTSENAISEWAQEFRKLAHQELFTNEPCLKKI